MRIRTIKPDFFLHSGLFDAEFETGLPVRLAFAGLWCAADREGRFKWEPRRLKIQILPWDDLDFSRVLDALATRGFVVRYACPTGEFGFIPSFSRHQVINNREKQSDIPEPPEIKDSDAWGTRGARVGHAGKAEGKGREGKGKEGKGGGREDGPPAPHLDFEEIMPKGTAAGMLALQSRIQGLRPEWGIALTYEEQQSMMRNAACIDSLGDEDWDRIRRYLSARVPEGAGFWQPRNRGKFLESLPDVHGHAVRWQSKQKPAAGPPRASSPPETASQPRPSREEIAKMLGREP